jgi:Ca-activated chloride channel family protein
MSRMALVSATLIVLTSPMAGQEPRFRAQTDLVGFSATITDRRGHFVTDLQADQVELLEDGVPQRIRLFTLGHVGAAELHIGLLLDTSSSMGDDIGLARSAAIRFLNTLSDATDMTLVDFDTEIRIAKYEQANFPRMVERIQARKPEGLTALYDALGAYLSDAAEEDGRKILVVFSDGGDTRSATSFSRLVTLLRASDATVYVVGLLDHQLQFTRGEQRVRLTQIAAEAGGEAFFPHVMQEVEEAYAKILAQIRAQYVIGYVSSNTKADGTWRKVEIKVKRPDIQGPRVQARKGYFAGVARQ